MCIHDQNGKTIHVVKMNYVYMLCSNTFNQTIDPKIYFNSKSR